MNIDDIREICSKFDGVQQDIKWGHDLVFMVGGKMFCVVGLDETPTSASFKVTDDEFEELAAKPGFKPAPYVAKYKWVMAEDINVLPLKDWQNYLEQSYNLVRLKLTPKIKKQFGLG